MKIPLLIFGGWGHAASTPFYYTLALDNKYCHGGHRKETGYLNELENYEFFDQPMWTYTSDPYDRLMKYEDSMPPKLHAYAKHDEEFIKDWIAEPPSIDKYINYYQIHYENIRHEYKAVADFTNGNSWLRESFLDKYVPILKNFFDIKCIFVARDPVRRSYSDFSAKFTNNCPSGRWYNKGEIYPGNKMDNTYDSLGELFKGELHKTCTRFYVEFYKKFSKYFPTLQIVMEDFWEPNKFAKQTERLSNFLDYPITQIHENAFWPEAGENAPKYDFLKDQWGSVKEPLTEELYDYGREQLDSVYSQWEDEFGSLPSSWGKHI